MSTDRILSLVETEVREMCPIALNRSPLMTRYLVEECRAFVENPVVIVDVGARDGVNTEWAVFGDQARIYCFEPDEAECARLAASAPSHVVYVPTALGRETGDAILYESKLAFSTSLYETKFDYFGRFVNSDNAVVVGQRTVSVQSLHDAMKNHGIPEFDFIKLDAEGAELDILKGGGRALEFMRPFGVLSEIRIHEEINGSPPFSLLDIFMQSSGFRLYDLSVNHHSRRVLPYPQSADFRHPSGQRFFAYTTHGQIQDGDALYFRDLLRAKEVDAIDVLKLCAFMEIYSLNDCAAELIDFYKKQLEPTVNPDYLLDLLAGGILGRETKYKDYMEKYFSEEAPSESFDADTTEALAQSNNQPDHVGETSQDSTIDESVREDDLPSVGPIRRLLWQFLRR